MQDHENTRGINDKLI